MRITRVSKYSLLKCKYYRHISRINLISVIYHVIFMNIITWKNKQWYYRVPAALVNRWVVAGRRSTLHEWDDPCHVVPHLLPWSGRISKEFKRIPGNDYPHIGSWVIEDKCRIEWDIQLIINFLLKIKAQSIMINIRSRKSQVRCILRYLYINNIYVICLYLLYKSIFI